MSSEKKRCQGCWPGCCPECADGESAPYAATDKARSERVAAFDYPRDWARRGLPGEKVDDVSFARGFDAGYHDALRHSSVSVEIARAREATVREVLEALRAYAAESATFHERRVVGGAAVSIEARFLPQDQPEEGGAQ